MSRSGITSTGTLALHSIRRISGYCRRNDSCYSVRFLLILIVRRSNGELPLDRAVTLLQHMRQLVSEQFAASSTVRVVSPIAEKDVAPSCEGNRVHSAAERVGFSVGMDSYAAEIRTESWLHLRTYAAIQRLAASSRSLNCRFNFGRHFCFIARVPR
jgi:hypothetical protein